MCCRYVRCRCNICVYTLVVLLAWEGVEAARVVRTPRGVTSVHRAGLSVAYASSREHLEVTEDGASSTQTRVQADVNKSASRASLNASKESPVQARSNVTAKALSPSTFWTALPASMLQEYARGLAKVVEARTNSSGMRRVVDEFRSRAVAHMSHHLGDDLDFFEWVILRWNEAATYAFLVFVTACVVYQRMTGDEKTMQMREEVRHKQDDLHKNIIEMVSNMEGLLGNIMHGSALIAELSFQAHRRDFSKFLRHVRAEINIRQLDDMPQFFEPFRCYIRHWLKAFEECSIHPLNQPFVIVQPNVVDGCMHIGELVSVVSRHIEDKRSQVQLVAKHVDELKLDSAWSECAPSAAGTAFAYPVAVIGCPVLGFCLSLVDFALGRRLMAIILGVVSVLSGFVMARFEDPLARLEQETKLLEEKRNAATKRLADVKAFYRELDQISALWLQRTVPRLDILKEVHVSFRDITNQHLVHFFESANSVLAQVATAVGPLEIWCGPNALHEDQLKVVALQFTDDTGGVSRMRTIVEGGDEPNGRELVARLHGWEKDAKTCGACTYAFSWRRKSHNCRRCGKAFCESCTKTKVPVPKLGFSSPVRVCERCAAALNKEAREKRLAAQKGPALPNMLLRVTQFSFCHIHVVGATNLKNIEGGRFRATADVSDPFVRLHISEEWVRTETVWNTLNPKWNQYFFLPVRVNDSRLVLEIVDDNDEYKHEVMGSLAINFRELEPSQWVAMRKSLDGDPGAELQLRIRFSETANGLLDDDDHATHESMAPSVITRARP